MKIRTATLLVAISTTLELIRFIAINFIISNLVEDWWDIDAITYLNQGIYIFFLGTLVLFFASLYLNQKSNYNE